ncbi:MAG: TVP38/TMEM64 family protein, partial [Blastocatellia bacterium]
ASSPAWFPAKTVDRSKLARTPALPGVSRRFSVAQTKNKKALLIALVIVAIGVGFLFLPVRQWFLLLQSQIESLGAIGPVVFALAYVVLTVLLIPGSALTLGAGAIFGLWLGAITVIIGANLGALCSFLLARGFLREKVERWAEANPRFAALDAAIGREGFKMVLLSRLSPVFPFTLLNYFLGLTRVRTGSYVIANLIGMLPGTFLYIYLGATARDALIGGSDALTGAPGALVKAAGLLATIAVVALVTRAARKAMAQVERRTDEPDRDLKVSEAQ